MLQSTRMKGAGDPKITLTSDVQIQNLEFALIVFVLAWLPHFFNMRLPLPPFWSGDKCSVPLYVGSTWSAFWFLFYRVFNLLVLLFSPDYTSKPLVLGPHLSALPSAPLPPILLPWWLKPQLKVLTVFLIQRPKVFSYFFNKQHGQACPSNILLPWELLSVLSMWKHYDQDR